MSFQLCQSVNRNTAVIPSYRTAYDKKYLKAYDAYALAQNTRPSCNANRFAKNNAFAQSKYVYPTIEYFKAQNNNNFDCSQKNKSECLKYFCPSPTPYQLNSSFKVTPSNAPAVTQCLNHFCPPSSGKNNLKCCCCKSETGPRDDVPYGCDPGSIGLYNNCNSPKAPSQKGDSTSFVINRDDDDKKYC